MRLKHWLIISGLFLGITFLFFYPFFLRGHLPFPGDLLVGHYAPWSSSSFLGYAPGGVPHKAQGIDVVRELFPWKHFSIETMKRGELPLWNPYNFSGNPHLANFQTGIFYPLNFIFFWLPFNLAWVAFIIFQPFLAALFTYLLARELKISRRGSFLAGVAFAFCLYFTVWIEYGNIGHSILWLPLALFLTEKIIKEGKIKWAFLLIFSLTFSILAGYIQTTIYLLGTILIFFLFRLFSEKRGQKKKIFLFLGALLIPFFLTAAQLLPTMEIFSQSARGAYPVEKIPGLLLPWFYPITNFASDFFGNPASRNYWYPGTYIERVSYLGVLPLFFALLAIGKRGREKMVLFFTIMAAASLLFTLNLPPIRAFYGLKIPIISTTVYTRLLSLFSFSMAILAGFGVDAWLAMKRKKPLLVFLVLFGSVYLTLWLLTFFAPIVFPSSWWVANLAISQRNLILPSVFFLAGAALLVGSFFLPQRLVFSGIAVIVIFDLFFYFHKITPFSPAEFVYPEAPVMNFLKKEGGINRFWGYGTAYIDTNFSTFGRTFSPEGYDPLIIRRYGELLAASRNEGIIPLETPRSDVILEKGFGYEALRDNFYRQRMLDLLGVKYVLHKNEGLGEEWQPDYTTFPEEVYELVWQQDKWQVYENKTALPRVFLVGDYRVERKAQQTLGSIFNPEFSLKEEIILEKELPVDFSLDNQTASEVEILDYQPHEIEMSTNSEGNKLLFLSDNFYPGWQVYLDGKPGEIYRANYSFRAVAVPQGEHRVVFTYQPESLKRGLVVSGLAFSGVFLTGFLLYLRKSK